MGTPLSSKLDSSMQYSGGFYGIAAALLTTISTAASNASTALANAATALAALATHAAGQALTLGRVTVDAILETPTSVAYAASVTLDTSVKNDFVIGTLTGNIAITLSNPAAGRQGFIAVRQDATGSRTVSISASGYTNYRDVNTADMVAAAAANAITVYAYAMVVVGGVNMLLLNKLTPVTP